ncbi:MAG: AEC family transporter [Bacteroidota bacterium]
MLNILQAIIPVFALVLIGAWFKRKGFPGSGFWPMADQLTYYVLLPSLLIEKLALADLSGKAFLALAGIMFTSILLNGAIAILSCFLGKIPARGIPAVFQGSIRPNTYVALAVANTLYGQDGLTVVALCLLIAVPLVNVLSVSTFALYIPENSKRPNAIIKNIAKNPLVIACVIGIFLNLTYIGLPLSSADLLSIISKAALPMGLLSVGNGLVLSNFRNMLKPVFFAFFLKLLLLPFMVFNMCTYLGLNETVLYPVVLLASVPCAVSSYILTGQLKGDQPLMAGIITVETLLAIVTMPLVLFFIT